MVLPVGRAAAVNRFRELAQDFPTQGGAAVVGLALFFLTGLAVVYRLARGADFPNGYEFWIGALVAMSGITTAGMVGKRMTDYRLAEIKTRGPSPVNVEAPSDVTVETQERGR